MSGKKRTVKGDTDLSNPWDPIETSISEHGAIKAMLQGTASEHQQGLVVMWIERATGVRALEFRPGDPAASAFAGGKRFIGIQFFTLATTSVAEPPPPPRLRKDTRP